MNIRTTRWTTRDGQVRYIRLYQAWKNLKNRITGHVGFGEYWTGLSNEFRDWSHFREWSLNHGYKKGQSIDRIDRTKGYSPENCEWITKAENCRRAMEYRWNEW